MSTIKTIIGIGLAAGAVGLGYWYYNNKMKEKSSVQITPSGSEGQSNTGNGTTNGTGNSYQQGRRPVLDPTKFNTSELEKPPVTATPNNKGGLGGAEVEVTGSGGSKAFVEITLQNIGTLFISGQLSRQRVQEVLRYTEGKNMMAYNPITTTYTPNQYGTLIAFKDYTKGQVIGKSSGVGSFYDGQEPTLTIITQDGKFLTVKASSVSIA